MCPLSWAGLVEQRIADRRWGRLEIFQACLISINSPAFGKPAAFVVRCVTVRLWAWVKW